MTYRDTADIVVALSAPEQRAGAAEALAQRLGVERLLLFVRDPVLAVLIPAPGFPQTIHGGPRWRDFVARCINSPCYEEEVDIPPGERVPATSYCSDGVAAVMLGGSPNAEEWAIVQRLLPMLAAILRSEQQAIFATSDARQARGAAQRAQDLASALDKARAEGAKLNARLYDEHRRKDDFLAMLGHELRNPLAPLVSAIELLRRQGTNAAAAQRHMDVMARQVRVMSRLVEDLLDVSRVSRGRIELRRMRAPVAEVIADAVENVRPTFDARRHEIRVDSGDEDLTVYADPVRLSQVFGNLLHNAAKYTDPGGTIEVTVRRDGGDAAITIADNGIGISRDMLPRVFDLFSQAPVSLARSQGGLGIGLTLVRALVELHGGRISADSGGLGAGSSFTVRLPITTRAPAPAPPPADILPRQEVAASAMSVLVVDDNQDAADSLAEVVRSMGHRAEVAYTGLEALQVAGDMEPNLVLLDIGLPDLDGYEVARRLRRVLRNDTGLVAVTGYAGEEDVRRSREAGFDGHIAKPVMPESLADVLGKPHGRAAQPQAAAD